MANPKFMTNPRLQSMPQTQHEWTRFMQELANYISSEDETAIRDAAMLRQDPALLSRLLRQKSPHGTMYRNVAAATTVTTAGEYYKAAGTTTAGALHKFSMPSDGRLQYDGVETIHAHIAVTISFTTSGINDVIGYKLYKTGSALNDTVIRALIGTGSDIQSTAIHGDAMMNTGDYLEVYCTNESVNSTTVTLNEMYFFVLGMLE